MNEYMKIERVRSIPIDDSIYCQVLVYIIYQSLDCGQYLEHVKQNENNHFVYIKDGDGKLVMTSCSRASYKNALECILQDIGKKYLE